MPFVTPSRTNVRYELRSSSVCQVPIAAGSIHRKARPLPTSDETFTAPTAITKATAVRWPVRRPSRRREAATAAGGHGPRKALGAGRGGASIARPRSGDAPRFPARRGFGGEIAGHDPVEHVRVGGTRRPFEEEVPGPIGGAESIEGELGEHDVQVLAGPGPRARPGGGARGRHA